MSMRKIQEKKLPLDWLEIIKKFDIESSSLCDNNKILVSRIIDSIIEEKENFSIDYFSEPVIKHIIFNHTLSIPYDNIPTNLFREAIEETKGEKGLNLVRKLHSVFIELMTYKELLKLGYQIDDYTRSEGSCDLKMSKINQQFNFEVKFKESAVVLQGRYFDYINGKSYFEANDFLRGKIFEIHCKIQAPNYTEQKAIFKEIDSFIENKENIFNGTLIQIFDIRRRGKVTRNPTEATTYLNSLHILNELVEIDNLDILIQKLFIDKNGHITKMSTKSKKFANFKGCLVWSIPFNKKIDVKKVEESFQKLELDFDLHVFLSGIGHDSYNFIVKTKCTANFRTEPQAVAESAR